MICLFLISENILALEKLSKTWYLIQPTVCTRTTAKTFWSPWIPNKMKQFEIINFLWHNVKLISVFLTVSNGTSIIRVFHIWKYLTLNPPGPLINHPYGEMQKVSAKRRGIYEIGPFTFDWTHFDLNRPQSIRFSSSRDQLSDLECSNVILILLRLNPHVNGLVTIFPVKWTKLFSSGMLTNDSWLFMNWNFILSIVFGTKWSIRETYLGTRQN